MKKFEILIITILAFCVTLKAQNVAISDDDSYVADPSAMLDVKSNAKGLLIPRLTSLQRTNIANPAIGLMVFDVDDNSFFYFNGTSWELIVSETSALWSKSGNNIFLTTVENKVGVGTSEPIGKLEVKGDVPISSNDPLFEVINSSGDTIFAVYSQGVRIYVADDQGIKSSASRGGFAVGGFSQVKGITNEYFRVTPDSVRVYINDEFASSKASGSKGGFAVGGFSNVKGITDNYLFVQDDSTRIYVNDSIDGFEIASRNGNKETNFLDLNSSNYLIGQESGANITTGVYNQFVGYQAGYSDTSGSYNCFYGYQSGYSNRGGDPIEQPDYGSYNTFYGYKSGYGNVSGLRNTCIGSESGLGNYSGSDNTFMGYKAGQIIQCHSSTIIGSFAGVNATAGNYSVFVGQGAGRQNVGISNTFVGARAGNSNTTGIYNTCLGKDAGYENETGESNLFLGTSAGYKSSGSYNSYLGYNSGAWNPSGINNVFLGYSTGRYSTGSGNIFIGSNAGYNQNGSNRLIIENSSADSTLALIFGDFAENWLRINNRIGINANPSTCRLFIQESTGFITTSTYGGIIVQDANNNTGSFFEAKNSSGTIVGKLDDNANFIIDGYANLKSSSTGAALFVHGAEAIWFNDTYFSWGYGGTANYFADKVGIGVTNPVTKLAIAGLTGTTSGSYLRIYNDNIYYYSSSKKTKENIKPLVEDFTKILRAQPVSFTDKESREENIGFIAEDFDDLGLKNLVIYENGEPKSLSYELVSIYNLEIIKKHEDEIREQNDKIQILEKQNQELMDKVAEIDALKAEINRMKHHDTSELK